MPKRTAYMLSSSNLLTSCFQNCYSDDFVLIQEFHSIDMPQEKNDVWCDVCEKINNTTSIDKDADRQFDDISRDDDDDDDSSRASVRHALTQNTAS